MNLTKKFHLTKILIFSLFALSNAELGMGIDMYGYFQSELLYERSIMKIAGNSDTTSRTSSEVSELDLFFHKEISPKISALVNLQFVENFSTENLWGDFNLDQAWVKFDLSTMCVIKVGHIIPIFNNFNEIKSRFPLFPFILRPAIYESFYGKMVQSSIFLPLHAALQVNGTFPFGKAKLDYAIFGGNSDFINTKSGNASYSLTPFGTDSTTFKMVGGRLGIRAFDIKLGVSGTYDYSRNDDINSYIVTANDAMKTFMGNNAPVLSFIDPTPRYRFGSDLSYTNGRISFEAEYIYIHFTPKGKAKNQLDIASDVTKNSFSPIYKDLDRQFAYAAFTYLFTEKFDATVAGYYNKTASSLLLHKGLYGADLCAGYHLNDNVTLKAQIRNVKTIHGNTMDWDNFISAAAVSVCF
jgi:hypothetical protein